MPLNIKVLLLSVLCLAGCASQKVQQQVLELQAVQTSKFDQQQAFLVSQQESLDELLEQQGQLQEVLEVNQHQLRKLLSATSKPKVKKSVAPKAKSSKQDAPIISAEVPAPQKMTFGRVESVWIDKLQLYLKARLDTGAKSSSIHATDIQYFERDGQEWVRFNMFTHKRIALDKSSSAGKSPIIEAPVLRTVKIKQASADYPEKRPVIKMRLRIGDYEDDAEFTLSERTSMLYPILIGRSFLQDVAVVDVGQVFIHKRRKD